MNRYSFIEPPKKVESKEVHLYTDGSCAPTNPGPGGFGIYCCDHRGVRIFSISSYIGDMVTNNQMEYLGMLMAVRALRSKALSGKFTSAKIFTDSRILVMSLNRKSDGDSAGSNRILSILRRMILDEIARTSMDVDISWIRREANNTADALSKNGSHGETDIQGIDIDAEKFEASAFSHLFKATKQAKVEAKRREIDEENDNWLDGEYL